MLKSKIARLLLKPLLLLAAAACAGVARSAPLLPVTAPEWKNVEVGDRKSTVFSFLMDSRGIMWTGTNNGLHFYDGVATHAVDCPELAGAHVYAMAEKDGILFLALNNGLIAYNPADGTARQLRSDTPKELRALLLDGDMLWVGGLSGIYTENLATGEYTDRSEGLPHKSVYSLLRDSRGIVYAGTYSGVARYEAGKRRFRPLDIGGIADEATRRFFANCLIESADGESIYVGGEGSLYRYFPAGERWIKIVDVENYNIKSLARGSGGHILIGTDNGVYYLQGDRAGHYRHDSRREQSLADNEIWCVYCDKRNNIWAGHERGFSIASDTKAIRTVKLSDLTHTGEGNEIYRIHRDRHGDLWLAGTNGIIRLSDGMAPTWYRHDPSPHSLSHKRVRAIHEDTAGELWLATDAGINRFNRAAGNFDVFNLTDSTGQHTTGWVYAIAETGGRFWTGTFLNGILGIDKSRLAGAPATVVADRSLNSSTRIGGSPMFANDLVNDMVRDNEGCLWILLYRDRMLTRYNPADGSVEKHDILSLTDSYPTNIAVDAQGRVWCAFHGGAVVFAAGSRPGIVRFPHTGIDEAVLAMGKVGKDMWISTLSNLWRVYGTTLRCTLLAVPQKSYTSVYEDSVSGKVMLGTTDEIVEVDRDGIAGSAGTGAIRMVIGADSNGSFARLGNDAAIKSLAIPYGGSIALMVSTLDYSPGAVQRFMYKIATSPADTTGGWVVMPEGSNIIRLSGLKMGHYTLLVRSVGSTASPVDVALDIARPAALSWWAITLYILAASGIVAWSILYTRKRNMRAFREQERQTALENVEKKLTFLSTISHDLKTPLSMIIGPVSLLREKARTPEDRKALDTVYDNAVRLNNMIHRTLELQHIEDCDESLLILSVFDSVEFCRSVFEVFEANNPDKKFVFHTSCQQLLIEADAVKFESVVTNLLSNACKYSDEGATISLGISRDGGEVEIVVSDDGVGIADIDQPLVFQRMFRAPATSGLREGTGLGLYLIKKYLELMGGNINLYSKKGQGTSFVVRLPLSEKVTPALPSNPGEIDDDKPKILIVDDNSQIASFISGLLCDDYTCLKAENGRSGLAIAASFAPDLIIADEMMPIMSGLEMVRRMKQHPRLASIPIIMLTAKSDNKTETDSIKLGIDMFMTKPFDPAALRGRIIHMLRARSEMKEKARIEAIARAEERPIEAESVTEKSLARIARIIEENISDPDLNVNLLCEKSGIPNKQLYRLIKKYMGTAPLDYIRSVRLRKAAVLLSQRRFTVSEISYMVGFKTPSYFAKCFQAQFGVKPSRYESDDETGKITDNAVE